MKQISLLVLLALFCCGLHGQELTPSKGTGMTSYKTIYCDEQMRRIDDLNGQGKFKEVMKIINDVIDYDPSYTYVHYEKAACLFNLDSLDQCLKYCDTAEMKAGRAGFLWNLRGLIYREWGNYDKAIICFDSSIRINPSVVAMYDYISTLNTAGREEEAFKVMRSYNKLYPNDKIAMRNIANLYYSNNMLDSAFCYVDKSLSIDSAYDEAIYLKGFIYFKNFEFEKAIYYFKQSIRGAVEYSNVPLALAEAYLVSEKYDSCLSYLKYLDDVQLKSKDKIAYLFIKLICNYVVNKNSDKELVAFNNLLETKHIIHWDFSKTDAWLAKATLTPQQRTLIEDITKKFKEYVGK